MLNRLRVGVVGLGYWGPNLARVLHELPQADLAWLCDVDRDVLARAAERFPDARCTDDVERLLEDPALDAVAIATPVRSHRELVAAALSSGKHVFVEKPLATSADAARALATAAEDAGLVLMPGHTFLYSPPVEHIRGLIESGELGEIYFLSMSRVNLGIHQPDDSVLWDLAPHDVAILRHWLGAGPSTVSAISRSCVLPSTPDVAFVHLGYAGGVIANLELSWLAPTKLRRTVIVGSEKMVAYDDTAAEPVRIFDAGVLSAPPQSFGEFHLTYRTGDIVSPALSAREPLVAELADFCDSVLTGSVPVSSARLGVEVVEVVEAIESSLARRGATVDLGGQTLGVGG